METCDSKNEKFYQYGSCDKCDKVHDDISNNLNNEDTTKGCSNCIYDIYDSSERNHDNTEAIIVGSFIFVGIVASYILCKSCIASGVFEGNIKTLQYLYKFSN